MASKHTHIDPATILALPYIGTPLDKHKFTEQLSRLAACLWQTRNSVSLVFAEDHYVELIQQFTGPEYANGRAREAKLLLMRYLGVRPFNRHTYGDSGLESRITSPLNESLGLSGGDAILVWADLLSSNLLINEGGGVPGYSHPSFALVTTQRLDVLVGDQIRSFPFFSDWDALTDQLEVVAPETLAAILVHRETEFVWEKTGHGATEYQKRVVERTARLSQVVIRSGTTYQNPQGSVKKSSIAHTDDASEFKYTVVDKSNVLRGIFKTRAATARQSKLALRKLEIALEQAMAKG